MCHFCFVVLMLEERSEKWGRCGLGRTASGMPPSTAIPAPAGSCSLRQQTLILDPHSCVFDGPCGIPRIPLKHPCQGGPFIVRAILWPTVPPVRTVSPGSTAGGSWRPFWDRRNPQNGGFGNRQKVWSRGVLPQSLARLDMCARKRRIPSKSFDVQPPDSRLGRSAAPTFPAESPRPAHACEKGFSLNARIRSKGSHLLMRNLECITHDIPRWPRIIHHLASRPDRLLCSHRAPGTRHACSAVLAVLAVCCGGTAVKRLCGPGVQKTIVTSPVAIAAFETGVQPSTRYHDLGVVEGQRSAT